MRRILGAACALVLSAPIAIAGNGYGEVTLVNQTSQILDLYVDDHYGCRALSGLSCSTMETAGGHTLVAKGTDGAQVSQPMELEDGGSFTYTVSESQE
jgi:hypothetical protein